MFYRYFFLLALLVLSNVESFATSSRIIDRFGGRIRTDIPCRLSMMKDSQMTVGPLNDLRLAWMWWLQRVNCTFVFDTYEDTGLPDDNGTYNGCIGRVQRGESDIFAMFIRPDALPYEPGLLGPVMIEADEAIFSRRNYSRQINREIASFVAEFDEVLYSHVAFALYMFSVLYAGVEWILSNWTRRDKMDLRLRDLFMSYTDVLRETFTALIGQMNLDPDRWSNKLLTHCYSAFMFVLVSGIVCNVIGSNLVVNPTPSQIDSVSWFNNESWIRPVIIKKMFLYMLLKSSTPGTTANNLWQVIQSSPDVSIIDANMEGGSKEEAAQKLQDLVGEVNDHKKAVIAPRFMLDGAVKCGCVYNPDLINHIHISSESIAEGLMVSIMSHQIHPYIREYFEYLMQTTCLEMGLIRAALSLMDSFLADFTPGIGAYGLKALMCQERKYSAPSQDEWRPFNVADLQSTLMIPIAGGATAFLVCVLETMSRLTIGGRYR